MKRNGKEIGSEPVALVRVNVGRAADRDAYSGETKVPTLSLLARCGMGKYAVCSYD